MAVLRKQMAVNRSDSLLSKMKIASELAFNITSQSVIMDFGCGSGSNVHELRKLGYQAFGCDLQFKDDTSTDTKSLIQDHAIRLIDKQNYCLPFEDNTFH